MKYRRRRIKRKKQRRGKGVLLSDEQHKKAKEGFNNFINKIKGIKDAFAAVQKRKELLNLAKKQAFLT